MNRIGTLVPALLLVVGCASGATPGENEDADVAVDTDAAADTTEDDVADVATDIIDTQPDPDVSDEPDVTDEPDISDEPDATVDVPVDTSSCEMMFGECTPRTASCSNDATGIVICGGCGEIIRTDPCDPGEICDPTGDSPLCRPCVGAECTANTSCEPGTVSCLDHENRQACTEDGTLGPAIPCPANGRCIDGTCGTVGGDTGATCTTSPDGPDGCKGRLCVCGDEYRATNGDTDCVLWGGVLSAGYCSTESCAVNFCDPATEMCADFALSGAYGGTDFCILTEGCNNRGTACGRNGDMRCEELPSRVGADGPITWELGCWLDDAQTPIGANCTSDTECIGGTCLVENVGGTNYRYCSARCGESVGCPSYSECVLYPGSDDNWLCMALANATDCPRLASEMFNFETRDLPVFGTARTAEVCYLRRD